MCPYGNITNKKIDFVLFSLELKDAVLKFKVLSSIHMWRQLCKPFLIGFFPKVNTVAHWLKQWCEFGLALTVCGLIAISWSSQDNCLKTYIIFEILIVTLLMKNWLISVYWDTFSTVCFWSSLSASPLSVYSQLKRLSHLNIYS